MQVQAEEFTAGETHSEPLPSCLGCSLSLLHLRCFLSALEICSPQRSRGVWEDSASSLHIPLWGDTQTSTGCEGNPNSCNEMLRLQKPIGWGCFHGLPLCSTSEQSAIRKTSEVDFRKQTRQRKRRHMNQRAAFHSESHQAPKQNAILLHGSCL